MLIINGKEYGLYYSVWAHSEFNDWILKNAGRSYVPAMIQKAVIMNKAYNDLHGGGEQLNAKDIMNLPELVFEDLVIEVNKQEAIDSTRTVETEDTGKNAESSAE